MGSASEKLITDSKADNGRASRSYYRCWRGLIQRPAFDPKPFIKSFEAAVDKLISIRKDVQGKIEQMEKSVRVAEREYSKKMVELTKGFEVWFEQLPSLSSFIILS